MSKPNSQVMSHFCSSLLKGRDYFDLTREEAKVAGLVHANDDHTGPVRVTRGFCRDYLGPRIVRLKNIGADPDDYPPKESQSMPPQHFRPRPYPPVEPPRQHARLNTRGPRKLAVVPGPPMPVRLDPVQQWLRLSPHARHSLHHAKHFTQNCRLHHVTSIVRHAAPAVATQYYHLPNWRKCRKMVA